ncbi:hypothetical protein [Cytobacillus praedii]|nr:hypothetical protein [Cytobacillus praedii]
MREKPEERSLIKRMKDEIERKARGKVIHKVDEGRYRVKKVTEGRS